MRFQETKLEGAWVIHPTRFEDDRGHFARTFCREEFAGRGLDVDYPQANLSFNLRRGTLRGLHLQLPPHEEGKLVRCSRGAIWDVIVDLRPGSETEGQWTAVELSAENGVQLFVPRGFAHGFLTLRDDTEVSYLMSAVYAPQAGHGYRYDDPTFAIDWPEKITVVSDKDRELPVYDRELHRELVMISGAGDPS